MLLLLLLLCFCTCDDSVGPLRIDTYRLTGGPSGWRDGTLTLTYTHSWAGAVSYQIGHPLTGDYGTFELYGSNSIVLYMQHAHRTGDFDSGVRRLELNDGTRWELTQ